MQLPEFLKSLGYQCLSLQRSGVGCFHTQALLKDRPVSALLDTGASATLISLHIARELGLSLSLHPDKGGGAGDAAMDVYVVEDACLELAELTIGLHTLIAMDLSHANATLAAAGASPIEAILGVDVLQMHGAVIDYGSQSLFLLPVESSAFPPLA